MTQTLSGVFESWATLAGRCSTLRPPHGPWPGDEEEPPQAGPWGGGNGRGVKIPFAVYLAVPGGPILVLLRPLPPHSVSEDECVGKLCCHFPAEDCCTKIPFPSLPFLEKPQKAFNRQNMHPYMFFFTSESYSHPPVPGG